MARVVWWSEHVNPIGVDECAKALEPAKPYNFTYVKLQRAWTRSQKRQRWEHGYIETEGLPSIVILFATVANLQLSSQDV